MGGGGHAFRMDMSRCVMTGTLVAVKRGKIGTYPRRAISLQMQMQMQMCGYERMQNDK
jgi:hypothetical protein